MLTSKFKEDVERKTPGLFKESIEEIMQYIKKKPQSYICHTCRDTLARGKMPCMSARNGLSLSPLADQHLKLSEIELSYERLVLKAYVQQMTLVIFSTRALLANLFFT